MAEIKSHPPDIDTHPDLAEMRERYEKVVSGRNAVAVDGLVLLAGLYLAISPWVTHFNTVSPSLAATNLVMGLTLAALGLGLALAPERMYRLSWTCIPIGVFAIIAPWVVTVGNHATKTMIWNNAVTGGLTCLLGLAAVGMVMATGRPTRH